MPTPYLYVPDGSNNIWQVSINDQGTLSQLQLPSGMASATPLLMFNAANIFSTSFQLKISAGMIQVALITYSTLYPIGLELDSANFQWLIGSVYVNSAWQLQATAIVSGLTRGSIVDAVYGYTEDRKRLKTYLTWLDVEINSIVHRKRYWWRKKTADFITFPNSPNYNLVGMGVALDVEQIVNLFELQANSHPRRIGYVENADEVQHALACNETGCPRGYLIVPGTTQTIRIEPIPNAQYAMRVLYWSGYNSPRISEQNLDTYLEQTIPLIPPSFHYVVLLAMQRRSFLMLYGKGDSRFKEIELELYGPDGEGGAIGDLERIEHPSVEAVENWKTHDNSVYVRSDRL